MGRMRRLSALLGFILGGISVLLSGNATAESGVLTVDTAPPHAPYAYQPLSYKEEEWYGSSFWSGPDWTRVGRDWQHPGENTSSIRSFICPREGTLSIHGRVCKADTHGGDGVRVSIRHEAKTIWNAELAEADSQGVEPNITLSVHSGETIRFIVHRKNAIVCDTTHWDPEIQFEGGPLFKASEGFSATPDDKTPWRYEMEETGPNKTESTAAYLYAWDRAMLPRHWNMDTEKKSLLLTSSSYYPLVVVTRRGGEGGTLLRIDPPSGEHWRLHVFPNAGGEEIRIAWENSGSEPLLQEYPGDWHNASMLPQAAAVLKNTEKTPYAPRMDLPILSADLWTLVAEAWLQEDAFPDSPAAFSDRTLQHLNACPLLIQKIEEKADPNFLEKARYTVDDLKEALATASGEDTAGVYVAVRRFKRELLLHRPEMNFGTLLFCKNAPPAYSHLVMQYFGWRARPGGGLFLLNHPGYSLEATDILDGKFDGGSILQPCLHWDGERILFSYTADAGRTFSPGEMDNERDEGCYHLWTVRTDGTGLKQLTAGAFDDLMPAWLPDGNAVFCSTRRKGYSRCFGDAFSRRWHTYTLHHLTMDDGSITRLSSNDVSEWFPVVGNDGLIYYSRWDYIDRDAVTHQTLWSSRPDGTNPMAVWGNGLPSPHCTFQIQPMPDSNRFVFVASAHHSITAGSLVLLDPAKGENAVEAAERITPEVPFPEAETRNIPEWYAAPWPLAEDLFLTAYSPYPLVWEPNPNPRNALGIYLIDQSGNRELIYRDPILGATNPIPARPRPLPPVVSSMRNPALGSMGEFYVADVYEGLQGVVPRGSIKELRVVQIFPKSTPIANNPPIGLAGEENARAILGTIPVAADGSVRFKAPAHTPLLFQLLDQEGKAVQIMRSLTYLQPGEQVSCVGCHEGRRKAAPRLSSTIPPVAADIVAGPFEGKPFSYVQIVQPILDEHCVGCHSGDTAPRGIDLSGEADRGFSRSYCALVQDIDAQKQAAGKVVTPLVPRYIARNQVQITPPGGDTGARGSLLLKMLDKGHNDVKLTPEEKRRLAMWIDNNAIFYGAFGKEDQALQLAGKDVPMPELE